MPLFILLHRMAAILYPSPLLTVKALPLPRGISPEVIENGNMTTYTKHYYLGTERISSALGTIRNLGLLCERVFPAPQELVDIMNEKVLQAQDVLRKDYRTFEKEHQLLRPFLYETYFTCRDRNHDPAKYDAYWYHPDHLNSNNSPYKFNGKEFDAETGNYYYGARYYNPKWSIWLSVDPLVSEFPAWSPYNFTMNNPINFIDPDGRMAVPPDDYKVDKQGNISLLRKTDDDFDVLYNSDESAGIQVDKGVLGNNYSQTGTDSKGDVFSYDILKVRGDEKASSLFQFMAGNTDVEWSQTLLGEAGKKGLNYLTTSHDKSTEKGIVDMINTQFQNGYSIRGHIHNHPGNTPIPSGIPGLTGKGGDMGFATGVTNWYNGKYPGRATPFFKIYTPKNGQYINSILR